MPYTPNINTNTTSANRYFWFGRKGGAGLYSDIDILTEQIEPDLFFLGAIKTDLEDEFGARIDIIRIRKGMNASLKSRTEEEAVYV